MENLTNNSFNIFIDIVFLGNYFASVFIIIFLLITQLRFAFFL